MANVKDSPYGLQSSVCAGKGALKVGLPSDVPEQLDLGQVLLSLAPELAGGAAFGWQIALLGEVRATMADHDIRGHGRCCLGSQGQLLPLVHE